MENQLIRGQVFDVLFNYAEKWGSICTESDCATVRDEICLRIDQSQFTADEAEDYINQEVEKRIAERMPSEEEIRDIVSGKVPYYRHETEDKVETKCFWFDEGTVAAIMAVYKYVRNRMMEGGE